MALPDKEEALKALGARVRSIRKEQNLPMQKLANMADIELSQVNRVETGKVDARYSTLLALARALKVDISEFFAK